MKLDSVADYVRFSGFTPHESFLTKMKAKSKFVPSFSWSNTDTFVGIEVEVEQVLTTESVGEQTIFDSSGTPVDGFSLWGNKEDGSLRNSGREFVSHPVAGENIEFALSRLSDFLTKNPRTKGHEFTDRTSVHVHMDFRTVPIKTIANLLLLYIAVEPALYNFCGGQRHKNIFCVPLNQIPYAHNLGNFWAKQDWTNLQALVAGWRKYIGINLCPLLGSGGQHVSALGTIEFRHMPGNLDVENICTWINMLFKLKNYAESSDFEVNRDEILQLNTSSEYFFFLSKIFDMDAGKLAFPKLQQRMEEMVLFTKCCFSPSAKYPEVWLQHEFGKNMQKALESGTSPLYTKALACGIIAKRSSKKSKVSPEEEFIETTTTRTGRSTGQSTANFFTDNTIWRAPTDTVEAPPPPPPQPRNPVPPAARQPSPRLRETPLGPIPDELNGQVMTNMIRLIEEVRRDILEEEELGSTPESRGRAVQAVAEIIDAQTRPVRVYMRTLIDNYRVAAGLTPWFR